MLAILVGMGSVATAQNDGQVEDRVVVIEKESKIELPLANRNYEKIATTPVYPKPQPQEYNFQDIAINLPKANPKIKIPTITTDPLTKLYPNYVKAGFGNYGTTYLEAFFNSKRSDVFNYGIQVKHLASANGSVKSELIDNFSRNSTNMLGGYVKYFAGKSTINADLGIARTRINYYGLNPLVLDTTKAFGTKQQDAVKQIYNVFSLAADIENTNKKDQLDYKMGFNYFNFADRFKASENEFVARGGINYELSKRDGIAVEALLSTSKRKDSSEISRLFFQLKPHYWFTSSIFDVKVGVNVAYTNDSIKAYDKLHFYPALHVDARVRDKLLTAFAGLDGEMQKNTLRSFVAENPFLGSNMPLYHTNKSLEFYAGGKGVVGEKLNYLVKISYANYKNLYLFNNNIGDSSRFNIFYAQGNSTVLNFNTDLSYEVLNQWRVGVDAQFSGYNISDNDTLKIGAWHRPTSRINIYTTYNLNNKIYFNFNFYYIGGIKARQFGTGKKEDVVLTPIVDASAKVEYKVSNSFSAFLELNNLLNKKYQLFQYYPTKGINVLVGLTYSF